MIFFYIIGLLVLIIASICDFKKREIPDILSYSFIAIMLFLRLLFSFQEGFSFFLEGIAGMFILGVFGSIFFYLGLWGGGDVKIIIGLGGLLGFKFILLNPLLIFLVCVAFAGAIYGIIFISVLVFIHFKAFKKEFAKNLKKNSKLIFFFIILSLISILSLFFYKEALTTAILICLTVSPLLCCLFLTSKSLEKICFQKKIPIEELTEGDWLTKEVKINENIIFKAKKEGLYKKDIEKLLEFKKQGLINDIEIKMGMPFLPVFFLAFVLFLMLQFTGFLKSLFNFI